MEIVMQQKTRYSAETRDRAIRMVLDQESNYKSRWATIQSIAPKIGCTSHTLRTWIKQHEIDSGKKAGSSTSDKERIKELERENKELQQANEILRKASAFFAQAELDRKPRR